jgi:hypothetical protein
MTSSEICTKIDQLQFGKDLVQVFGLALGAREQPVIGPCKSCNKILSGPTYRYNPLYVQL